MISKSICDGWKIRRVDADIYKSIVPDRENLFNEPEFCELNKDNADEVYYLIVMKDESERFGVIIGRRNNVAFCPFSAPSSYPVAIKNHPKQESIDATMLVLHDYLRENGIKEINWVLPPMYYNENLLSGFISAFYRLNYNVKDVDVSYALDLQRLSSDRDVYGEQITSKGRKGLRRAERNELIIKRCESEEDYKRAYDIVKAGHEYMGYPVRLSFEKLMKTLEIVDHDVFIVEGNNGEGIVSEFLYRINKEIVLGVYTGTMPEQRDKNGMNLLTYFTIKYYSELGYKIIDKSISTAKSEPNYGLMNFKESVGCSRSLKYSFKKVLYW